MAMPRSCYSEITTRTTDVVAPARRCHERLSGGSIDERECADDRRRQRNLTGNGLNSMRARPDRCRRPDTGCQTDGHRRTCVTIDVRRRMSRR